MNWRSLRVILTRNFVLLYTNSEKKEQSQTFFEKSISLLKKATFIYLFHNFYSRALRDWPFIYIVSSEKLEKQTINSDYSQATL